MATRSFGKYEVVEPLESGGMAEVLRARDTGLDRIVAVKVIHGYLARDPGFVERFRREAKLVASLRHPNIVQVYDFDVIDGQPFMVMEFLEGGTLKERLERMRARDETLPLVEIARLLGQIAGALDYAHSLGAIHRDIKPANVMFRGADEAIITDFGVAKMLGETGAVTVVGTVIGSPTYMSPEQAAGTPVDERSDLYSLGVILYQMAVGRAPFESGSPTQIVMAHLNQPTPPPREFNPALPASVQSVILRSMAKNPAYRYASANEMADAFRAAVRGLDPTSTANELARGLRMALSNQAGLQPHARPLPAPSPAIAGPQPSPEDTRGLASAPAAEPTVVEQPPALDEDVTVVERRPADTAAPAGTAALRSAPTEIVRRPASPPKPIPTPPADVSPALALAGRTKTGGRFTARWWLAAVIALVVVGLIVAAVLLL